MVTISRALAAAVALFNALGVIVGYAGIERLKTFAFPPFHRGGLYHIIGAFWGPPNWLILAWDSSIGRIAIWFLCLAIQIYLIILIHVYERPLLGGIGLTICTFFLGMTGFWILLHSIFNAFSLL